MNLVTIIVTRSKSCSVKTLHAILRLNMRCLQKNVNNEIVYTIDDPYAKAEVVQKYMKSHDRILFIDFGIGIDDGTLDQCFEPHEGVGCVVFPGVKEGIDWEMFKNKVKSESTEPIPQMGLHFDTDVNKQISENIYQVVRTDAKVWIMNTKILSRLSKIKSPGTIKYFQKCLRNSKNRTFA